MIKLIRELRNKSKKYTYNGIISPNLYNKIEENFTNIKFEDMLKILNRLETGLDELLYLSKEVNYSSSSKKIDFIRRILNSNNINSNYLDEYKRMFKEKDKFYYLILYIQSKSTNDDKNRKIYSTLIWEKINSFDEYLGSDLFCLIHIISEFDDEKFYIITRTIKKNIRYWRDFNNLFLDEIEFYINLTTDNRHRFSRSENINHIKTAVKLSLEYQDGILYSKSVLIYSRLENNIEDFLVAKRALSKYDKNIYKETLRKTEQI